MSKRELVAELKRQGLRADAFSFYTNAAGEECVDVEFGTCDLGSMGGLKGAVAWCTTLDTDGNVVELRVSEELIGGHLGRLAGAF